MEKSSLHFKLLGTSFSIAADEDTDYLEKLLNKYKNILDNTQKATGVNEALKLAILTGFLLCDEIEKMKQEKKLEGKEAEQRTLNMIARIDEVIPKD
ncbi:MAG: cell division protein ZapA [Treponema sp.]|nr:cell division protein ZapA [Treponema sp.]